MNIKTTLLSLLSLTATVTTPALAGYQYQGVSLMDGSDFGIHSKLATPMIEALTEVGVPVVDGGKNGIPMCQPEGDKIILGFYVPATNIMVICTQHNNKGLMMETLTHESVHVVQDLRTGIENSELDGGSPEYLSKLATDLHPEKIHIISSLYDKSDWEVETEAFYFEDKPQTVVNEIQKWAF